ncbi:MAG: hypothetical protein ABJF10_22735 [Chthoniobacter sp.]|uniref:hypothetical protein n=1 Tax=Chthoniobacter sp. TaxID=2510640 RepID=UPI0032AE7CBE
MDIDAPSKSSRVVDGVEQWLLANDARDLHRIQDRLEFRGNAVYSTAIRRRRENPKASLWRTPGLRGLTRGTIEFHLHAERVVIHFALWFAPMQMWQLVPALFIGMALVHVSVLLAIAVSMATAALFLYASWSTMPSSFRSDLHLAAIRGLADGAARELAELQSR